jgi:GAF domain-containing protein
VGRKWSREEVALAQAAAERASLALENARLVHEAQRRAAKERTIGEISGKIGSLIDIDNILQMAAQELGRTMPGAEVVIQFQSNGK